MTGLRQLILTAIALCVTACNPPMRTMKLAIRAEGGAVYDVLFAASPARGEHVLSFRSSVLTNIMLTGVNFSFVVNNVTNTGSVAVTVFLDGVESGSSKGSDMVGGWFKPTMGAKKVSIHGE